MRSALLVRLFVRLFCVNLVFVTENLFVCSLCSLFTEYLSQNIILKVQKHVLRPNMFICMFETWIKTYIDKNDKHCFGMCCYMSFVCFKTSDRNVYLVGVIYMLCLFNTYFMNTCLTASRVSNN